ncbi:MAG: pantoate--beta-alanine ligase [Acidobacteria bacterium]|nr:pantoate--beta-alanine ligase [Acidobacteriota bacterium]
MEKATTIEAVRKAVDAARKEGKTIAFVPTMGYLHEGHLALVDAARRETQAFVVISIFVNPRQFGDAGDLEAYPRDEARDCRMLDERKVDLVFLPDGATIYPPGFVTRVSVEGVAVPLEGELRPGHFDGVATVVTKLFNIVSPDVAFFGEKDAQQCAVVRRLVRDLDFPVRIETIPTVRDDDGLAMSSRNVRLSSESRARSLSLFRALRHGRSLLEQGASEEDVENGMRTLAESGGAEVEYLRVVDPETFESPTDRSDLLLVGAVRVDEVRLIDNMPAERQLNSGIS